MTVITIGTTIPTNPNHFSIDALVVGINRKLFPIALPTPKRSAFGLALVFFATKSCSSLAVFDNLITVTDRNRIRNGIRYRKTTKKYL